MPSRKHGKGGRKQPSARAIIAAQKALPNPEKGKRQSNAHAERGRGNVAPIKWAQVNGLLEIQATQVEVAHVLGISVDTLQRAVLREHNMSWTDYAERYTAKGRVSLRRLQFKTAKKSEAMQRWLGRHWLGQQKRDTLTVNDAPFSRENMQRLLQEMTEAVQEEVLDAPLDHHTREQLLTGISQRWRNIFLNRLADQPAEQEPEKEAPTTDDVQRAELAQLPSGDAAA